MSSRIPKSAQRAIDKANQQSKLRDLARSAAAVAIPLPRRMEINVTPRGIMNMHQVFFNGELQMLCVLADVDAGRIRRWTAGKGNQPAKGAALEDLYGKVEIRRRMM